MSKMAKLLSKPYPMPVWEKYDMKDMDKYYQDQEKTFSAIPRDKLLQFPVADGYAFYYIVSLSPLVLQHIAYMDAWEIPAPYIRGLRTQDAVEQIEHRKKINEYFKKAKKS